MKRPMLLLAALALAAAACGGNDAGPTSTSMAMDDTSEMGDMGDGMAMNMGDPNAPRADAISGADLARAEFTLLDTRPPGYDAVSGTAWIARHDAGTTVTLELSGLQPGVEYIAHLHEAGCADKGGPHFKFDPDGTDVPPNEIHLAFEADGDGSGFMTAENAQTVGADARSVVVHPVEFLDNKVACAEF